MGDMEVRTAMMNTLLNNSMFAQQRNDPDMAILDIEALNEMLPPKFMANLDVHRPTEPERGHDKSTLRPRLDHARKEWQYYSVALKLVVRSVSRWSYAMRAQYMNT